MPLLRLITALTVAAHSALGCCWHHQHAWADGCPLATACGHDHHAASPSHSDDGEHEGDHPQPHGQPCEEGDCVYVRETPTVSIDPLAAAPAESLVVASLSAPTSHPPLRICQPLWLDVAGPPVRLHLLKRVMLL